jgi:putative nucleotidyltransferase with HDIG domain
LIYTEATGGDLQKKILIVEDDEFFRETLFDVLKDKYKVYQAPNGKSACEILSIQPVDAVVSDIQMPGFSGIELLEWCKKNKPVPFVMMTGFSTLLETKSAFDLGAKGFISKPFKIEDLITCLEDILPAEKVEGSSKTEKPIVEYCKVSIDEFVTKPRIDFDVYIKLSETNIVRIANKNQELPRAQLNQYKAKGVKFLYILKEDFSKLVQFNLDLVSIMKDRDEISQTKKVSFIKYTGEVILERTFVDGIDKENLAEVSSFIKLTVGTAAEAKENFDLLGILSAHSDQIYAHSLGVSMYSVLIAKKMGFESNLTLFKLGMAGLFHDIGKKEIDKEILLKPRHLVSKDERQLIESHVVRGYEILSGMKSMSSDVTQMVFEHHEDMQGLGYPLGKSRKEQHPLSKILQLANIFVDHVTLTKNENKPVVAEAIINYIEKVYGARVDADALKALRIVFSG